MQQKKLVVMWILIIIKFTKLFTPFLPAGFVLSAVFMGAFMGTSDKTFLSCRLFYKKLVFNRKEEYNNYMDIYILSIYKNGYVA